MSHPFEQLCDEVNILANLLRKGTAELHRADFLPSGALQVLKLLKDTGGKTVPELGKLRVTSRQNVQVTVNRLLERGLVTTAPNPHHKKSVVVTLTAQGLGCVDEAERRQSQYLDGLAARISEPQTVAATQFLRELRQILCQNETVESQSVPARVATAPQISSMRKPKNPMPQPVLAAEDSYSGPDELPVSLL